MVCGPCAVPGPVIAVEDADVEQFLENDMKRRNEIAYDIVGDVVRPQAFLVLTFPSMSVTSPNLILSVWISGSKGMTFWKFSAALAMGWSNLASTSVFTSSSLPTGTRTSPGSLS